MTSADEGFDGLPWPDPTPFLAAALAEERELPRRIGRYSIVAVLGEGGMGVVYRARQDQPAREVALKVLHPAAHGRDRLRRFEREIETLGRLEHRGIARMYEAGEDVALGARVLYFAMELVEGLPITRFAAERGLDARARLRLLAAMCEAVHYAHQRGIIHRDLKPANVLVGGDGEPKVLDFGIARVADPDLAQGTLQTEAGQLLGTIAYMSPEQVSGDQSRVGVESDVYALGVIGYELLSGRLPLDVRHKTLSDATRAITDQDPLAVSTFDPALAGDVDAILSTALRKEKERRYASPAALAADIERFLRDEPVLARTPTWWEGALRLWRRRRAAALALLAVLSTLAGATAVSIWFALGEADQRKLADRRREEALKVTEFQAEMLLRIDVGAMGRGIGEYYREQVTAALEREPIEAAVDAREPIERQPIGREPIEEVAAASKATDPTATSPTATGAETTEGKTTDAKVTEAKSAEARATEAALRALDAAVSGADGTDVARRILEEHVLAPAARTLDGREDPPAVRAKLHVALGKAYRTLGLYDGAEQQQRSALALLDLDGGGDPLERAEVLNALALALQERDDMAGARELFCEALEIRRERLGPDDKNSLIALVNVAGTYEAESEREQALALYRDALQRARAALGNADPLVATTLVNLGLLLHAGGALEEAESALREALVLHRAGVGGEANVSDRLDQRWDATALASNLANLGRLLVETRRAEEGETLLHEALALHERTLGRAHPRTVQIRQLLANALRALGRAAEEERCWTEIVALLRAQAKPDLLVLGRSEGELAGLLSRRQAFDEAALAHAAAVTALRDALGPDHPELARIYNNQGFNSLARRDLAGAEHSYREAIRIQSSAPAVAGRLIESSWAGLARALAAQGKFAEAEPAFSQALALSGSDPAGGAERRALFCSSYAQTLAALERFVEAEAMLSGLDAAALSKRANIAVHESRIELYERWHAAEPEGGHAERAAQWRSALAELRR